MGVVVKKGMKVSRLSEAESVMGIAAKQPGIELATSRSLIRRPTTTPPRGGRP